MFSELLIISLDRRPLNVFFLCLNICCYGTEAYLEPNRKSTMELFCENSSRLLAVDYFCKKAPS